MLEEFQIGLNFFWKLFEWIGIVMKKLSLIESYSNVLS